MKHVLIWILMLQGADGQKPLTSGSAEFDTFGACFEAMIQLRSLQESWTEEKPVVITRCMPTQPTADSLGACMDAADDITARNRCLIELEKQARERAVP